MVYSCTHGNGQRVNITAGADKDRYKGIHTLSKYYKQLLLESRW